MNRKTRHLAHAALIAAMYVALSYLQNILLPSTTSLAIQFRIAEALCVLAFFSPAAITGLSVGCFLYNTSYSHTLPLDFLVGTLATFAATGTMYLCRRVRPGKYPIVGLLLPGIFNGLLVGWELTVYVGGGFALNALSVFIGESAVLLILGPILLYAIRRRHLDLWLRN